MKRTIYAAILLLFVAMARAQQAGIPAQGSGDEVHLRATVNAIVPLSDFSGEVTPVDVDPRFALTVRIKSADPAVRELPSQSVVTLAIHSPSLLFAGEPTKGKTYSFDLHRIVEDGKPRFFGLRVATMEVPTQAYSNAAYVTAGAEEWTGCDLVLTRLEGRVSGYVMFYESFWGEPTYAQLQMSDVDSSSGVVKFSLRTSGFVGKYALQLHGKAAELRRLDMPESKSVTLRKQADSTVLSSRMRSFTK